VYRYTMNKQSGHAASGPASSTGSGTLWSYVPGSPSSSAASFQGRAPFIIILIAPKLTY